jgi:hypothetical protein
MKIVAVRDPSYAPCGWLVCQVADDGTWNTRDDATTRLVDSDWDFPGLAANWGYVPCTPDCGTDGTVPCEDHPARTVGDMISGAWDWLEEHGSEPIDDPGYFSEG